MSKISVIFRNFDLCLKFRFLTKLRLLFKISRFNQNCNFCPTFRLLSKIAIFRKFLNPFKAVNLPLPALITKTKIFSGFLGWNNAVLPVRYVLAIFGQLFVDFVTKWERRLEHICCSRVTIVARMTLMPFCKEITAVDLRHSLWTIFFTILPEIWDRAQFPMDKYGTSQKKFFILKFFFNSC